MTDPTALDTWNAPASKYGHELRCSPERGVDLYLNGDFVRALDEHEEEMVLAARESGLAVARGLGDRARELMALLRKDSTILHLRPAASVTECERHAKLMEAMFGLAHAIEFLPSASPATSTTDVEASDNLQAQLGEMLRAGAGDSSIAALVRSHEHLLRRPSPWTRRSA